MIKLKKLITEFTDNNFSYKRYSNNLRNQSKVKNFLKSVGIGNIDVKGPEKHLKKMEDKGLDTMFVHVLYHYIKGKDGKVYFLHQSQYWVSDYYDRFTGGEKINVTQLFVQEAPNYPDDKGEKTIGVAMVPTDKLLAGLRKVDVIKKG